MTTSKKTRSILDTSHVLSNVTCFLCDETDEKETLYNASTFNFDSNIREWAKILCDDKLLAKLSAGDLIALEAKYHKTMFDKFILPREISKTKRVEGRERFRN